LELQENSSLQPLALNNFLTPKIIQPPGSVKTPNKQTSEVIETSEV